MTGDIIGLKKVLAGMIPRLKADTLKLLEVEGKKSIQLNFDQQGRPAKWKKKSVDDGRAILTGRTSRLQSRIAVFKQLETQNSISIGSNLPYAKIHNEGGDIRVTSKMKGYFWAMYKKTKDERYKGLALKKVGSTIKIPQRQFLTVPKEDFPRIMKRVDEVVRIVANKPA